MTYERLIEQFAGLLDVLQIAFAGPTVSEGQYHEIVAFIRNYAVAKEIETREHGQEHVQELEQQCLRHIGYPIMYHPCDHDENIRWGLSFGVEVNPNVEAMLTTLRAM